MTDPPVFRRDTAPHRGRLLRLLAGLSAVGSVFGCLVVPGVLALPLAVATILMARHDLREIRSGRMDPHGLRETATAQALAEVSVVLGLLSPASATVLVVLTQR
jgi:hypothetical protein